MKYKEEKEYEHEIFHKERKKIEFLDKYIANIFFDPNETTERKNAARTLSTKYVVNCNICVKELTGLEKKVMEEALEAWKNTEKMIEIEN
ncbi:MAG: hypothetical protein GX362_01230 [Methanosarcinaceae archaeon]|nr:hypothetical protein [Methanosarcinaceae archaeon]